MGNNQSTPTTQTADNRNSAGAYIANLIIETTNIPTKYFGGDEIDNDDSLQQVHQDLLSVDDTIKRLFTRKPKPKQPYQVQQPINSIESPNYIQPAPIDEDIFSTNDNELTNNNDKHFWRCTYCTTENKLTEYACRRCRQAETKL